MKIPRFIPAEVSELEAFVTAGVFGSTEVQAVTTFVRAAASQGDAVTRDVIIAAALAVRAPLHGHVCVDLGTIASTVVGNQDFSSGPLTDDEVDSAGALAGEEDAGLSQDQDSTGDPVLNQQQLLDNLKWPDAKTWLKNVAESPLVRIVTKGNSAATDSSIDLATQLQPLVIEDGRLYLTRFWSLERYVAADLLHRSQAATVEEEQQTSDAVSPSERSAADEVERLFKKAAGERPVDQDQLEASLAGVHRNFVVISGGPGTGKTTTVATFLAGLVSSMQPPAGSGSNSTNQATQRIALAAPTGKAAARMTEAIRKAISNLGGALDPEVAKELGELDASTIHRLLGASPGTGFRHNPSNPLPHDIVIVDEVSMVSLSLMAHLLAAIRPDAKVVLVGDPYQLASIEAGAVLGDIVGIGSGGGAVAGTAPPAAIAESVRVLTTVHRQGKDSGILKLAECIRQGDADGAMEILKGANEDVIWVDPTNPDQKGEKVQAEQDLKDAATKVVKAAQGEDAEIEEALKEILSVKVLSALRRGPTGVDHWNQLVENYLRSEDLKGYSDWYAGRPVMVTKNDYLNGVFNGDVGVAIAKEDLNRDDRFQVWFERAEGNQMVEATRLDQIATQWAMSIHKSQGSEFEHVVVSMPPPPSRILTRELLYTAVTRAKEKLTIVATEESITEAIKREVARSSGLAARLEQPTRQSVAA
ncbi:MAG: exodeoxyribonuclease V subunit alpha [Actinomycetes bacterium]